MNYSDQVYGNVALSLKQFLEAEARLSAVDIRFLEEWDPSRHHQKPVLLISNQTPRMAPLGIDGGFRVDVVDDLALTVDTIHAREITFDFTLDLGTDTAAERSKFAAIMDRVFEDAEAAGIPVYALETDSASTAEVGRISFCVEDDLAHFFLPEMPADRTWRDALRFTPSYLHFFTKFKAQPKLTGVELSGKEVRL